MHQEAVSVPLFVLCAFRFYSNIKSLVTMSYGLMSRNPFTEFDNQVREGRGTVNHAPVVIGVRGFTIASRLQTPVVLAAPACC